MNCPKLPTVPPERVNEIDPAWFKSLNQCLEFAMTHPQPDGFTIFMDAGGTLRLVGSGSGDGTAGAAETKAGGPFAVTIEDVSEDGAAEPEWTILLHNSKSESGTAGMVTIGSYREMIEDQEWDPQEGIVYLDITYDPETEEYDIIFDLEDELPETGDEQRYILRIAEITYDAETETWTAHQIRDYGDIEVLGRWVR